MNLALNAEQRMDVSEEIESLQEEVASMESAIEQLDNEWCSCKDDDRREEICDEMEELTGEIDEIEWILSDKSEELESLECEYQEWFDEIVADKDSALNLAREIYSHFQLRIG